MKQKKKVRILLWEANCTHSFNWKNVGVRKGFLHKTQKKVQSTKNRDRNVTILKLKDKTSV